MLAPSRAHTVPAAQLCALVGEQPAEGVAVCQNSSLGPRHSGSGMLQDSYAQDRAWLDSAPVVNKDGPVPAEDAVCEQEVARIGCARNKSGFSVLLIASDAPKHFPGATAAYQQIRRRQT